ncbi:MAG: ABC transporter ATP-binding protein [Caldilineaceae bacterium]
MEALLKVDRVSKTFAGGVHWIEALQAVSFAIYQDEFVCLLGPSGSGKSTLLRIIGGLVPADNGVVLWRGQAITAPHPEIGLVFQKTNLMPWRTVLQNVLLPVEVQKGRILPADIEQAQNLLTLVGLGEFSNSYPRQLSGGMSQRVVLARTLLQRPKLLLMDEPFGALDALTRERLNVELLRIQRHYASTVLMVTHSIQEAIFMADRVLILSDRCGAIEAEIAIDLPRPRRLVMMSEPRFGELAAQIRQTLQMDDESAFEQYA